MRAPSGVQVVAALLTLVVAAILSHLAYCYLSPYRAGCVAYSH
jgi:hypothetical protein